MIPGKELPVKDIVARLPQGEGEGGEPKGMPRFPVECIGADIQAGMGEGAARLGRRLGVHEGPLQLEGPGDDG